jgi:superfamily II DNA/RNA helicase
MNISNRSEYMLKYQKAKAKLIEYAVNDKDYPNFPLNSNDLSYSTIYIISNYAESLIEQNIAVSEEFYPYLKFASQYFDAAVNSKDRNDHDEDFLLSGATAYFLSDDYGSAKVLASRLSYNDSLTRSQYLLLSLFRYLFFYEKIRITGNRNDLFGLISSGVRDYFETGMMEKNFWRNLHMFRDEIYKSDDITDIFYVDILFAVIIKACSNSAWRLIPDYSQLDTAKWKNYLCSKKSMKILWPSQQLIGEKELLKGKNAIVQLPTGVGKTKSIEIIIRSAFLCERATTAVIVAPLRALCNEITSDMFQAFETDVIINQFSDVLQEDFILNFGDDQKKHIVICTPEKLNYIIHHQKDILTFIDLFIFDEAHMFDDGSRGAIYELLVSEVRKSISDPKQIIMLSAVLSNADEIGKWMFDDNGVVASSKNIKSTPKSIGFATSAGETYYYSDDPREFDFYIPKSIEIKPLNLLSKREVTKSFPNIEPKDLAVYFALKLCSNGGIAIYVNRADSVKTTLKRLLFIKNRGYNIGNITTSTDMSEAQKIQYLISIHYGDKHEFAESASLGAFPHYSDLSNGVRVSIEYAMRNNKIRFVVCTSTLAQGVNIPIKYLFMTSFKASRNSMQIRSFQNLIGRTARSGMYTEGSIIITDTKFHDNKGTYKGGGVYRWRECIGMFNSSNAEACGSSILSLIKDLDIDFETPCSGKKITEYIIENYDNKNCFINLIQSINNWYLKRKPTAVNNNVFYEIMLKKTIIESIENYLCFIFFDEETDDLLQLSDQICKDTLAYQMASDEEKGLLLELFKVICQKVLSLKNKETMKLYSKTMIGIDFSDEISQWLTKNKIGLVFMSENELLDKLIEFFYSNSDIKISLDSFSEIVKLWIFGKTYFEILNDKRNTQWKQKINDIEALCNKTISYDFSFLIGNIIDLLEVVDTDKNDDVNPYNILALLQKKIKYGVSSLTAISICENVFNDRFIAREIVDISKNENIGDKEIIIHMGDISERTFNLLEKYPSYFSNKLATILGEIVV